MCRWAHLLRSISQWAYYSASAPRKLQWPTAAHKERGQRHLAHLRVGLGIVRVSFRVSFSPGLLHAPRNLHFEPRNAYKALCHDNTYLLLAVPFRFSTQTALAGFERNVYLKSFFANFAFSSFEAAVYLLIRGLDPTKPILCSQGSLWPLCSPGWLWRTTVVLGPTCRQLWATCKGI